MKKLSSLIFESFHDDFIAFNPFISEKEELIIEVIFGKSFFLSSPISPSFRSKRKCTFGWGGLPHRWIKSFLS